MKKKKKDIHGLKVKWWKKVFYANTDDKKAGYNIYIRKKKRLNNDCKKRDKERTLCDNQGISQTRTYNDGKYVDTQHRSTLLHKASTNRYQGRNWQ